MKIYYIANARMPTEKAHGIQLAKMCEAFLLSGIDLELVVPNRAGSRESIKDFYGLKVDIPIKRLPILNLGFILSSLTFMVSYYFYLRKKREGIIYTIDMDNFSFFLIPFLRMPFFSEIHDSKNNSLFWSRFLNKISGAIVINSIIKNNLIKNFKLPKDKVIVKPNGIDLEMFSGEMEKNEARNKLGVSLDKKMVVYIGREISWKGMEIIPETQKLSSGEYEIKVVSDRPFAEIPLWLAASDILLLLGTKKNDYSYLYTSPMKVFEYMASLRPILASDTPANREILSNDEAYFYEADNAQDLDAKIKEILTNPYDLKLKINSARNKVEGYTWKGRAGSILEYIRKDE